MGKITKVLEKYGYSRRNVDSGITLVVGYKHVIVKTTRWTLVDAIKDELHELELDMKIEVWGV